jgi:hypothetical protein
MKKILLSLLIALPAMLFAQKKIEHKIYLYGDVTNKISSNMLIHFIENDPDIDYKTVRAFSAKGVKSLSWNSLFLPGTEYSRDEINKSIEEKGIKTILEIEFTNVSIENLSYAKTDTETKINETDKGVETTHSAETKFVDEDYVAEVALKMSVFSIENGFRKPVGVIMGDAKCNFERLSTQRSISWKILKRMIKGLEKENAFK